MKNEKTIGGGWRAKEGDLQVAAELEEIETEEEEQRGGLCQNSHRPERPSTEHEK